MATASSYPIVRTLGFGYDPKLGYFIVIDGVRMPVGQWFEDELEVTGLREEALRTYLTMTKRIIQRRPKP